MIDTNLDYIDVDHMQNYFYLTKFRKSPPGRFPAKTLRGAEEVVWSLPEGRATSVGSVVSTPCGYRAWSGVD